MSVADRIVVRRRHSDAKLSLEDVALIRGLWAERERLERELSGLSTQTIAEKFDVPVRTVLRAAHGDIATVEDWS